MSNKVSGSTKEEILLGYLTFSYSQRAWVLCSCSSHSVATYLLLWRPEFRKPMLIKNNWFLSVFEKIFWDTPGLNGVLHQLHIKQQKSLWSAKMPNTSNTQPWAHWQNGESWGISQLLPHSCRFGHIGFSKNFASNTLKDHWIWKWTTSWVQLIGILQQNFVFLDSFLNLLLCALLQKC